MFKGFGSGGLVNLLVEVPRDGGRGGRGGTILGQEFDVRSLVSSIASS